MMRDSDLLTACMSYSRELCAGSATHAWGSDCNMQGDDAGFLGHWNSDTKVARNCNVTGGANNVGCQMRSQDNASCGEAFNQLGSGGAYVTLLLQGSTVDPYEGPPRIASWFFRREKIPLANRLLICGASLTYFLI